MTKYQSNTELPENVKSRLPDHAKDIYREAFNSTWEQYDKPHERKENRTQEETAHAVAWSTVKKEYKKNEKGKWIQKK